ncbi:MAG: GNAT family N-acetyltransferase [Sulfitobacter sp.]
MLIRHANPEDASAITALTLASKRSNGYDDAFMAACVDELSVSREDIARDRYWVAQDGDTLRGCVCLAVNTEAQTGVIESFFIDPHSKRQGIGRLLWQAALDAAYDANLKHLTLDSDPAAVPFYEALGFKVIGQTPSGSIPGRTLPQMRRILSPELKR